MERLLVTGGAGFIGSNFVRLALARTAVRIVVLDKLTYAGSRENLGTALADPRVTFVEGDIADAALLERLFRESRPDAVLNLAAETHVDRSIEGPRTFVRTNVLGTFELLEASRRHLAAGSTALRRRFRFVHVSTDEVYGSLGPGGRFDEDTPYAPNSPYSATKASADHLARAYHATYGLPAIVTNCSNNFGPYQFPEKLVPVTILNAIDGRPIPIYGDGLHVRDWLHVDDHTSGLLAVLEHGKPGERYHFGGACEKANLEVVDRIGEVLESLIPAASNPSLRAQGCGSYLALKRHVEERRGHDRRYAMDFAKARRELGWAPLLTFDDAIVETVRWYLAHRDWAERRQAQARYHRERLGLHR